jgi:hypothetical protein
VGVGAAQLVISEISDSAPTALQAVKLFAIYTSQPAQRVRPCSAAQCQRAPASPSHRAPPSLSRRPDVAGERACVDGGAAV